MARNILERLSIALGVDIKDLQRGLSVGQGEIKGFAGTSTKSLNLLKLSSAAAFAGAGAAVLAFTKQTINAADAINDAAGAAKLSTTTYQQYQKTLALSNISQQEFNSATTNYANIVGKAAAGNRKAEITLNAVGIELKDVNGNLKTQDQLMEEALRTIGGYASEQEKVAAASLLFGDAAGPKLAAALAEGSTEIEEQRKAMNVLSDESIKAAAEINDQFDAFLDRVTTRLQQATLAVVDFFTTTKKEAEELKAEVSEAQSQAEILAAAGIDISSLPEEFRPNPNRKVGPSALTPGINGKPLPPSLGRGKLDIEGAKKMLEAEDKAAREAEKAAEAQLKKAEAIAKVRAELTLTLSEQLALAEAEASGDIELVKRIELEIKLRELKEKGATEEQLALAERIELIKMETERREDNAEAIMKEIAAAKSREEEIAEAVKESNERVAKGEEELLKKRQENVENYADLISSKLGDAFNQTAKEGESAAERIKRAFVAAAIEAAAKFALLKLGEAAGVPIPGGAPAGGGGAGGGGAGGGIVQTALPFLIKAGLAAFGGGGFAEGGSGMVGGSGGTDSKMVSFRATPGELVNVEKPGAAGGRGGRDSKVKFELVISNNMETKTEQQRGPNGEEIIRTLVKSTFQDEMTRRGSLSNSVNKGTGTRRPPKPGVS